MNEDLKRIFKQSSSVNFISGRRGFGKTDFALKLLEIGLREGLFAKIASNVTTFDDRVEKICYFDRLEIWLRTKGRKAFLLDELGKHLNRMRFMTQKSKLILDTCQLMRKFDAHLIGVAPSKGLVNKLFLDTDILDSHMVKLSLKIVEINNYVTFKGYELFNVPRTTIKFLSKDIAVFELKDATLAKEKWYTLPQCCRAAKLYLKHRTVRKVGNIMGISHTMVCRLLDKHIRDHETVVCKPVNSAEEGI